ncbi:uncharacterized protein LOC127856306 [Dreissena polymorpha]|uniref:Uncharacterized protein n=1 Tax=Dreissena polymorpha TaxID=45954 RepID=A0A9D4C4M7_DREPO|nr:uncharacterized protein LOC127856306 [Dreissena polymorpha]KAH3717338.1 hypothetical protein DPMN_060122 [Dreissena polymorpha]
MHIVDVVWACCCLTILSVPPVNGANVIVSPNITVKPTPYPPLDPGQRVDITLTCVCNGTGLSNYDLSYYVRNSLNLDFKDNNSTFHPITKSFHNATGDSYEWNSYIASKDLESGRFVHKYEVTNDNFNHEFILSIHDPVDSVILSLYDSMGAIVGVSNASVNDSMVAREIKPGKYTAQCQATGSNPAPKIEIKLGGNIIVAFDIGFKAIVSGRPSYSSIVRQNTTIAALDIGQFLTCEANIPGTYYATKVVTIQLKAFISLARDTSMGDYLKVIVPVIVAIVIVVLVICRKRRQNLSTSSFSSSSEQPNGALPGHDHPFSGAGNAPISQHSLPNQENHVYENIEVDAPVHLDNTIPKVISDR